MSSEDAFNEQYAAWHLYKGGPVALVEHVTVTARRPDQIRTLKPQTTDKPAFFSGIGRAGSAMGAGGKPWAFAL